MNFFHQIVSQTIRRFSILLIFLFLFVFLLIEGLVVWIFFLGVGDIRPQGPVFVPNADVSRILEGWNLYRNYEIGFEIMHPRSTMISVREEGEADEVRFDFPMIYPGIFARKYFELSIGDRDLGLCKMSLFGLGQESIRIGDLGFTREFQLQNIEGRTRDFTRYYTIKDDTCYRFEFVIDFKEVVGFGYDPATDIFRQREAEIFNIIMPTFGFIEPIEKSNENE